MERLNYLLVKLGNPQSCRYCNKKIQSEAIHIHTRNDKVLEFFGKKRSNKTGHEIIVCTECFNKFKDLLEEFESEGWTTLEDEEFSDEDLNIEDGSGNANFVLSYSNQKNPDQNDSKYIYAENRKEAIQRGLKYCQDHTKTLRAVLTTKEYQRFNSECPIFVKQRPKKLQKFYKECLKKGEND